MCGCCFGLEAGCAGVGEALGVVGRCAHPERILKSGHFASRVQLLRGTLSTILMSAQPATALRVTCVAVVCMQLMWLAAGRDHDAHGTGRCRADWST